MIMRKAIRFFPVLVLTALTLYSFAVCEGFGDIWLTAQTPRVSRGEPCRVTVHIYHPGIAALPETEGNKTQFSLYYYVGTQMSENTGQYQCYGTFRYDQYPVTLEIETENLAAGNYQLEIYTKNEKDPSAALSTTVLSSFEIAEESTASSEMDILPAPISTGTTTSSAAGGKNSTESSRPGTSGREEPTSAERASSSENAGTQTISSESSGGNGGAGKPENGKAGFLPIGIILLTGIIAAALVYVKKRKRKSTD